MRSRRAPRERNRTPRVGRPPLDRRLSVARAPLGRRPVREGGATRHAVAGKQPLRAAGALMALRVRVQRQPPDVLPGSPTSHFQLPAYEQALRRFGQRVHWIVVLDGDRTLATWLVFAGSSDFQRPPQSRILRTLDVRLHTLHGPVLATGLA